MKLRHAMLACLLPVIAPAYAVEVTDHYSDGYTSPYLYGAIRCPQGSRCALRKTGTLTASSWQTSRFTIMTGNTTFGPNDHYAFGVRGNGSNQDCSATNSTSPEKSFPFLGRGVIVYPTGIKFENFTNSCVGGEKETIVSSLFSGSLAANREYQVYVSANDRNIYFDIWRVYTAADGQVGYQFVQGGDCLYMGVDPRVCGRNATYDRAEANRTFVLNTKNSVWDVSSWYID